MPLHALAGELASFRAMYNELRGFADARAEEIVRESLARRIAALADEIDDRISTTAPSSLEDCIVRLKLLRTPEQFHPDDCDIALGRVIAFLEGYAAAGGAILRT